MFAKGNPLININIFLTVRAVLAIVATLTRAREISNLVGARSSILTRIWVTLVNFWRKKTNDATSNILKKSNALDFDCIRCLKEIKKVFA